MPSRQTNGLAHVLQEQVEIFQAGIHFIQPNGLGGVVFGEVLAGPRLLMDAFLAQAHFRAVVRGWLRTRGFSVDVARNSAEISPAIHWLRSVIALGACPPAGLGGYPFCEAKFRQLGG